MSILCHTDNPLLFTLCLKPDSFSFLLKAREKIRTTFSKLMTGVSTDSRISQDLGVEKLSRKEQPIERRSPERHFSTM